MSTEIGRRTETIGAQFLADRAFTILDRNWRTRWCEIDTVALHGNDVYFVEVKYRATSAFGSGFDYITQRKLRQMQFAAEFWLGRANKPRLQPYLAGLELSGSGPVVDAWLPDVA